MIRFLRFKRFPIIHGDLHGGNGHFAGPRQLTLFDFDHGGYGWRAYDRKSSVWTDPFACLVRPQE
jgi:Ser/Thr protein kinase RdoA (MazF antagonist)